MRVAIPENFAPWVRNLGFPVAALPVDARSIFDGTQSERYALGWAMATLDRTFAALVEAACGADVVVASMMAFAAPSAAALAGARYAYVAMCPSYLRNDDLPFPGIPFRVAGPAAQRTLNRALWAVTDALSPVYARPLNAQRARHGLPPVRNLQAHVAGEDLLFVASDAEFLPVPAGAGARTRAAIRQTGAWRLAEPADLEPRLESFLAAGPPPVYVGFGSMRHRGAGHLGRLLRDAIERAGVRAILARGWSGLAGEDRDPRICRVDEAPHDALFPRVAAVVHHGGAGTTATALRAGVPQVLVPHLGDQYGHGWRVAALGLGPGPLGQRTLRAEPLARAIRQALDDGRFRACAAAMAARLAGRNGALEAAYVLEESVGVRRAAGASRAAGHRV